MSYAYLDDVRKAAEAEAKMAFKDHLLTSAGEGRWWFRRPDSWIYGFGVISAPRLVVMYGDVGSLMLEPSDRDALGWLRSVTSRDRWDLGYIASKVVRSMTVVEFQQGLVDHYVKSEREAGEDGEHKDLLEDIEEHGDFESAADFNELLYNHDHRPDEGPDVEGLTHTFMFQIAGLALFCRALANAEKAAEPPR